MKLRSYVLAGFFFIVGLTSALAGFGDKQLIDLNVIFGVPEARKVPMTNGLFLVPIKINGGSEEYYFLLDTGAMTSSISASLATKLGLRSDDGLTMMGVGGSRKIESTIASDLRLDFPGVTVTNARMAVMPNFDFAALLGHNCAGLLGFDILKRTVVQLDYVNQTVKFIDPQRFTEMGQIQIPLSSSFNQPKLEISVLTHGLLFTAPLILDTGSSGGIQLAPAFIQQNPNFELTVTHSSSYTGFGGTATQSEGLCPEIRIGDQCMENQYVQVMSQAGSGNGLLGAQTLSQYDVTVDVPDGYLLLRPNGHGPINRHDATVASTSPQQAAPSGPASSVVSISVPVAEQEHLKTDSIEAGGMVIKQVDGSFVITSIEPGAIGAGFGLKVGDVVVQVDQTSVTDMDLSKLKDVLSGEVRRIGFLRGGDAMTHRVKPPADDAPPAN